MRRYKVHMYDTSGNEIIIEIFNNNSPQVIDGNLHIGYSVFANGNWIYVLEVLADNNELQEEN